MQHGVFVKRTPLLLETYQGYLDLQRFHWYTCAHIRFHLATVLSREPSEHRTADDQLQTEGTDGDVSVKPRHQVFFSGKH